MPIEFSCTNCNKLLRVPDGSEGKPCQCPACGIISTVPSSPIASAQQPTSATDAGKGADGSVCVTCPNCQYPLRCQPELMGTKGQCKQCKHIFVIGENSLPETKKTALVFSCPKCSQLFDGKAEMAGRKGRCHACGEVFVIELREAATEKTEAAKPSSTKSTTNASSRPAMASQSVDAESKQSRTKQNSPAKNKSVTSRQPVAGPTIQLVCGGCRGEFEVAQSLAGQKTSCPHCLQLLQVPVVKDSTTARTRSSVFDQPTDDIFGGLNVSPPSSPASNTSSSPFDFGGSSAGSYEDAGALPYMYPAPASYQPSYQPSYSTPQSSYPTNAYQAPAYQSPADTIANAPSHGTRDWLRGIASWHRQVIWSFLSQIVLSTALVLVVLMVAAMLGQAKPSEGMAIALLIGYLVSIAAIVGCAIWFVVSYIVLCIKLYEGGKATLYILGYFLGGCVPFLSLVLLIIVLSNASSTLKQNGVAVGFLGADPNSI